MPVTFFWDTDDARLVVCETRCISNGASKTTRKPTKPKYTPTRSVGGGGGSLPRGTKSSSDAEQSSESSASVMFITADAKSELKTMETMNLVPGETVLNLSSPYVVTLKYNGVDRKSLCNFIGIESSPPATRTLILDFSIFVADGKMDEAFRCIRSIQSDGVWKNLAQMCVKTGRLDVAKVCLGHLGRAISVRAIRKAMEDDTLEDEAKVAVLAIELDMIADAERLYKKCGRYDLLNRLLQGCGRFEEALQIAERLDRVHLKNTYFQYAEWLKEQGQITKALGFYNKSNNATHNVTQMLISDPVALKVTTLQNTFMIHIFKCMHILCVTAIHARHQRHQPTEMVGPIHREYRRHGCRVENLSASRRLVCAGARPLLSGAVVAGRLSGPPER